eukprot:COSAG01_NODE_662_length_14431_cov_31.385775_1_plen_407_part_10
MILKRIKKSYVFIFIIAMILTCLTSCKQKEFISSKKYKSKAFTHKVLIPKSYHNIMQKNFYRKYFNPWFNSHILISRKQVAHHFKYFAKHPGYNEAKTKRKKEWYQALKKTASLQNFPNTKKSAITIAHTSLRKLPTLKPHFSDIYNHADDYPIDNFQNSTVPANTPVHILHLSKKKDWAYVYAGFASGWINIKDLAYVSQDFINKFRNNKKYLSVIKEKTPIYTLKRHFIYNANIGMILPYVKSHQGQHYIKVAKANADRYAYLVDAILKKNAAVKQPYLITIKRIQRLSNRLLDQPYGWGGMHQNRDCSSLVRDLFIPFGIYLPRNSRAQAKQGGVYLDFKDLKPQEREAFVIKNSIPYLTLLWLPGHIMLYVGVEEGRAMVLHNLWGVRSKDELQRKIVGKVLI